MKVKLIALDLDGTLLNSYGYISNETIDTIKMTIKKGVQVVLATGRSVGLICEEIKSIKEITYVIASNGAAIIDLRENKSIFSEYITTDILKEIIKIIQKYPIIVEFYSNGYIYMDEDVLINPNKYGFTEETLNFISENHKMVKNIFSAVNQVDEFGWLDYIEKVNLPLLKKDMRNQIFNSLLSINNKIKVTSSVKDNLEINSINANKGNGLKKLTKLIDIDLKETVAIGDNNNDVEMLEMAGIGIAMGNASEEIKMKADFIALNNDENGAAKAILQILNENL